MPNVAIIGGGIAGLACAHRLRELSAHPERSEGSALEFKIFESGPRLGGPIETEKRDGFLLEKGADSFISEKPAALRLCERLGISSTVINTEENNRRIFIVKDGRLVSLPEGFYLVAPGKVRSFLASPLFSWPGKVRMLLEPWAPPKYSADEETVAAFLRRRFGTEALARVGQPMLAGIYTGDAERLSMNAVMPWFLELEKKYGSVTRGLRKNLKDKKRDWDAVRGPRYSLFLSLNEGMGALIRALVSKLPPESVFLNCRIKNISYDHEKKVWVLLDEKGTRHTADAVCAAVPPRAAGDFLNIHNQLNINELYHFEYESLAAIHLAYKKEQFRRPLSGFGFISPRLEKNPLIACTFSSQKFKNRAPEGFELLRAFVGGAFGKNFYEKEDADLMGLVGENLSALLGIKGRPVFSALHRHPRSMVQYTLGHRSRVEKIREEARRFPRLFFAGSAYDGVGIPDCVKSGETAAEEIFEGETYA
ncbi:MAG: protoporphyrinogen oxidase [Candidatus Omnitrophica bacterium]|nr:protoporphyrinogen oxidase [Candidatus Omnitrophota bacterium]